MQERREGHPNQPTRETPAAQPDAREPGRGRGYVGPVPTPTGIGPPSAPSRPTDVTGALESMLVELRTLRALLAEQRGEGVGDERIEAVIPGNINAITFARPLMALTLINDGPNTVQYRFPSGTGTAWQNMNVGEVKNVQYQNPCIRSLDLQMAVAGGSASVRVSGVR